MPTGDVSIVIPTWNGRHLLEQFLPSVIDAACHHRSATGAGVEIVVVDDGSTDGTAEWVAQQSASMPVPVRLVRQQANLGFAEACNRGVRDASHDLVLLLNNDLEIARDAIPPLAAHFTGQGAPFAVHCRAIDAATGRVAGRAQTGAFARGFLRVHGSYEPLPDAAPPFLSLFASGGCAMFDRALFLELGGFDPLFAPYYYEDVELSYRAWKRGHDVHYEPASVVRHRFSSTIGRIRRGRVQRISQRNRLFFHWIHLHDRGWFRQHLIWLPGVALASVLSLGPSFALGLIDAIARLGDVRRRRTRERTAARRSDREVARRVRGRHQQGRE